MATIYQLKIELKGSSKPPVWRQIQVDANMNLHLLHCCIQGAMGWFNTHLHQYFIDGQFYGVPHPVFNNGLRDERKTFLRDVLKTEKAFIEYEYDYGNSWKHIITLERILNVGKQLDTPMILKGQGACPPEDCDGIIGFEELKYVMSHPKHPKYEELSEWLEAETFDQHAFDLALHQEDMVTCYKQGLTA